MSDAIMPLSRDELTALIRQIVRDEMQTAPVSYTTGAATAENWQAVLRNFIKTPSPELGPVRLLLEDREKWRTPTS